MYHLIRMADLLKKSLKWVLYFLSIFFVTASVKFFQKENLTYALAFLIVSFAAYSFLIIKDFKFLSVVSYITLVLSIIIIIGLGGGGASDEISFATANYEKTFYITLGILTPLILVLCMYLIKMGGWRRTLSHIFLVINFIILIATGTISPAFHNNFIYTRISIGIIFIYSIYLIFKKEKLPRIKGIVGILGSVIALLISSFYFSEQTYVIVDEEREEMINFIEPKAQEMFQSYNQRDFENFCKHYTESFRDVFTEEDFQDLQNMYGNYISRQKEPDILFTDGTYYIEYTVKFGLMDPIYFTFLVDMDEFTPDGGIRGFNSSPEQALEIVQNE